MGSNDKISNLILFFLTLTLIASGALIFKGDAILGQQQLDGEGEALAKIYSVENEALYKRASKLKWTQSAKDTKLYKKDRFYTGSGSKAVIFFPSDNLEIQLGENSLVEIDSDKNQIVSALIKGFAKIKITSTKNTKPKSFKINDKVINIKRAPEKDIELNYNSNTQKFSIPKKEVNSLSFTPTEILDRIEVVEHKINIAPTSINDFDEDINEIVVNKEEEKEQKEDLIVIETEKEDDLESQSAPVAFLEAPKTFTVKLISKVEPEFSMIKPDSRTTIELEGDFTKKVKIIDDNGNAKIFETQKNFDFAPGKQGNFKFIIIDATSDWNDPNALKFNINATKPAPPKKMEIKLNKLTPKKGRFPSSIESEDENVKTLKWEKNSQISHYEVQVSYKKNFSNILMNQSIKNSSFTITRAKKDQYVRARQVDFWDQKSAWTSPMRVKAKKKPRPVRVAKKIEKKAIPPRQKIIDQKRKQNILAQRRKQKILAQRRKQKILAQRRKQKLKRKRKDKFIQLKTYSPSDHNFSFYWLPSYVDQLYKGSNIEGYSYANVFNSFGVLYENTGKKKDYSIFAKTNLKYQQIDEEFTYQDFKIAAYYMPKKLFWNMRLGGGITEIGHSTYDLINNVTSTSSAYYSFLSFHILKEFKAIPISISAEIGFLTSSHFELTTVYNSRLQIFKMNLFGGFNIVSSNFVDGSWTNEVKEFSVLTGLKMSL